MTFTSQKYRGISGKMLNNLFFKTLSKENLEIVLIDFL